MSLKGWPEKGETECAEDAQTIGPHTQALAICTSLVPDTTGAGDVFAWGDVRGYILEDEPLGHILDRPRRESLGRLILTRLVAWVRWRGVSSWAAIIALVAAAGRDVEDIRAELEESPLHDETFDHPLLWSHDERMALVSNCANCDGSGRTRVNGAILICVDHATTTHWPGVLVAMDWLTQNGAWHLVHEWRPATVALPTWVTEECQRASERVSQADGITVVEAAHRLERREWRWEGDHLLVDSRPSRMPIVDGDRTVMRVSNHWRVYPPLTPSYYGR